MHSYTEALTFAAEAHDGQLRKYTRLPYITHPVAVATLVHQAGGTDRAIQAALLHDTVEDTDVTLDTIARRFGGLVADMVLALTDYPDPQANRAARKLTALRRLAAAPADVQTIKVADLIDNTSSIVEHDAKFAAVYLPEKKALLDALVLAEPGLRAVGYDVLHRALARLPLR